MSENQTTEREVLSEIQAKFEQAQEEFLALLAKIEADPKVLLEADNQARLAELKELVSATHQQTQQAAAQFNWTTAAR